MTSMTKEEYERQRRKLIEDYSSEIDEHESAGCFGDAENSRKWLRSELRALEDRYEGRCES
jgi:hypothetical protein